MDVRESMKKQNELAMFLARHVFSSEAKHSNIVFSPASTYSALTLVASAPSEPSVSDEILCFLKSSSTDELNAVFTDIVSLVYTACNANGGPEISSVNGVWIEKTLSLDPKFKELFENFFKAAFKRVDFQSKSEEVRTEVNSWVQERTNDLIKDLLPPGSVSNVTERVYANALYFKGTWQTPFDDYDTRNREFYLLNGSKVSVPFMTSDEDQYIAAYDGFKVARLPFQGRCGDTNRTFAMYFYLPCNKDGLDNLVERIATTPGFLDAHVPSCEVEVGTFRIPKFEISFGFLVSEVFKQLELDSHLLYHKGFIKVDESGVEAAAATADESCGCYFGMESPKRIDFVADHPFLFLIREDTIGSDHSYFCEKVSDHSYFSASSKHHTF